MTELLTIPAVAERLTLTPRTIRNYIELGLLPAVKLGGLTRIRLGDYQRFLAELPAVTPASRKRGAAP
jgi:excisionase family DNA binding protein